jgi:hypothetical protein
MHHAIKIPNQSQKVTKDLQPQGEDALGTVGTTAEIECVKRSNGRFQLRVGDAPMQPHKLPQSG